MAKAETFVFESDNLVRVKNLRNKQSGTLVTGATVTAELFESDRTTQITGMSSNPVTLSEIAGKNGLYEGFFDDTASVTVGQDLTVKVVADAGAGQKLTVWFNMVVQRGEA